MKLSVLVPSIRKENLQRLYESIGDALKLSSWEMVIIGPYGLPDILKDVYNVRFIEDWGPPLRAQQRGLVEAQGDYISWAADDGWYLPNSLDRAFELLEGKDYKTVIMGKYQEGDRKDDHMETDKYYILNNHDGSRAYFLPENTYMLNCGVISRQILLELGGWDANQFWVCPIGYNDLAIRLQKYGCPFIIQQEMMFACTHLPGETGDHGPIHNTQVYRDQPMYQEIYNHPYFSKRISIDVNNWQKAPAKWDARFGRGE